MKNLLVFIFYSFALSALLSSPAQAQTCGLGGAPIGGVDSDGDGYTADGSGVYAGQYDCDDANHEMYPGVWRFTGGLYSKCDGATGDYTTGVAQPSEATGSGQDIFIDFGAATNGDGSFANPYNTVEYFTARWISQQPVGYRAPVAGDAYWFKGTTSTGYSEDGESLTTTAALTVRTNAGTELNKIQFKQWPGGAQWLINGSDPGMKDGIKLYQTSNIIVDGVEIYGGLDGVGIWIEGNDIEVRNSYIHDYSESGADNPAGIRTQGSNYAWLHHNRLENNGDVTHKASINNRNVVHFRGTGIIEEFNLNGYTDPTFISAHASECSGYKHADEVIGDNGTWENRYNRYYGCSVAVGTSQAGSHIHHNYMQVKNYGVGYFNIGGPFFPHNLNMEYNTVIGPSLISIDGRESYSASPAFGNVVRKNVHLANSNSYNYDTSTVRDTVYGNAALYAEHVVPGAFDYAENCYYNQGTAGLLFNHFTAGPPNYDEEGGAYTLASWALQDNTGVNNKPPYDNDSYQENPLLDTCSSATSTNCADKGYLSNFIVPTVLSTTTTGTSPALYGSLGTASTTATIQVSVNNNLYTATNDEDGTWSLSAGTISPPLAPGIYDVGVTVTSGIDSGTDATTNELVIQSVSSPPVGSWWSYNVRRPVCRYTSYLCP